MKSPGPEEYDRSSVVRLDSARAPRTNRIEFSSTGCTHNVVDPQVSNRSDGVRF